MGPPSPSAGRERAALAVAGRAGVRARALRPDAQRVMTAMRNGIGQMPSYRTLLSEAQIQAVAAYVAKAAGR